MESVTGYDLTSGSAGHADSGADAALSAEEGLHPHSDHRQEDQRQVFRGGRHSRAQNEVLQVSLSSHWSDGPLNHNSVLNLLCFFSSSQ